MTVYVLGAGASASAGYPLASKLLPRLSDWLDRCDPADHWVTPFRNRLVQVSETFGSLVDFETILGKLEEYGDRRVTPTSLTTYHQDSRDIWHDCAETLRGANCGDLGIPAEGFYPQYLRSDLITGFREFFYQIEQNRFEPTAYDSFASQRITSDSIIITFNYDVALERALAKASKWDVGTGYGYTFFRGRTSSPTTVYKLHGSVNWFQTPMQENPPPYIVKRDLALLGYDHLTDPRLGQSDLPVNNTGTFILPGPQKKFFWERFWAPLWGAAAERLRGASKIFIHGYSMPPVDSRARELMFGNIDCNATIGVYCRSSSDRIADEFRGLGFTDVEAFPEIGFETWAIT